MSKMCLKLGYNIQTISERAKFIFLKFQHTQHKHQHRRCSKQGFFEVLCLSKCVYYPQPTVCVFITHDVDWTIESWPRPIGVSSNILLIFDSSDFGTREREKKIFLFFQFNSDPPFPACFCFFFD